METAKHSPGAHRFKWHWDGKYYTPQGVEVPEEVWREDELLIQSGQALAPDDQVLDMKVTLPHPFVLSPILPEADNSLPPVEANVPDQGLPDEEEEEVEEEVEEDTPEGKKVVKKTVKRKKAAKRK
jgi:hypothetical protein